MGVAVGAYSWSSHLYVAFPVTTACCSHPRVVRAPPCSYATLWQVCADVAGDLTASVMKRLACMSVRERDELYGGSALIVGVLEASDVPRVGKQGQVYVLLLHAALPCARVGWGGRTCLRGSPRVLHPPSSLLAAHVQTTCILHHRAAGQERQRNCVREAADEGHFIHLSCMG